MHKHSLTTAATALAFLTLAACGGTTGSVTDDGTNDVMVDDMTTVQDLVAYLETEGYTVATGETMNEPVFGVNGTQLTLNGQQVQVFEFASEEAADEATADISGDGMTIGTSQVDWVSEPHFYQDGNLVVLYVGTDDATLDALEDALGAQIAGGDTDDEDDLVPGGDTSETDTSATGAMMDAQ